MCVYAWWNVGEEEDEWEKLFIYGGIIYLDVFAEFCYRTKGKDNDINFVDNLKSFFMNGLLLVVPFIIFNLVSFQGDYWDNNKEDNLILFI